MPQIDFAGNKPKFVRPELLCHGQIPAPMAGVAPRVVLGKDWWDVERRKAYAANNFCCWACGNADSGLEAHEVYDIDYMHATMTFVETTALCVPCHSFIHLGYTRRVSTEAEFKKVAQRGFRLLKKAKLKANWGAAEVLPDELWTLMLRLQIDAKPNLGLYRWASWRLIIAGDKYPPKFRNEREADKFYKETRNE